MQLIRKRLSESEGTPPGTRYNPDTDTVQITPDGGLTWTDDPGSDPRKNPAFQLPPNTAPDVKCAAAAGMVAYIQNSVDTAIEASTVIGLANGIFAIIVAFLPITILAAVVIAIAEFLLGLGAAALIAAFTEETYDELRCILYCYLDDDGRLTEEGLANAQVKIASEIGDVVVDGVLVALISGTGYVGFNNAGAALADEDADCSECEDCTVYFCIEIPTPTPSLDPITGCGGAPNTWFNWFQVALNDFGSSGIFQIDRLEMDIQYTGAGSPAGEAYFVWSNGNCSFTHYETAGVAAAGLQTFVYEPVDLTSDINRIMFSAACSNNESNSAGNILQFRRIRIEGHSLAAVPDLLYLYDSYRCD